MSMLFYIDSAKGVALHPEVIKLCASFNSLNDKEVCYIVLAYDYNSKYRQFPEHQRKIKAMWEAFGENESELIESPRILIAAKDYTSLQYSPDIELARSYQRKVDLYLSEIENEDDPKKVKIKMDLIRDIRSDIKELEKVYDLAVQKKGVIKGKMQLSWLEDLMSNKKNFESVYSRPPKIK